MITNYMEILAINYPNVQAHMIGATDVYSSIVWDAGDPLPSQEDLDALALGTAQENAWLKLKAYRDARKAGGVKVGDYWYESDDASRIQQIGLVMLGSNIPTGLQWKTMSGVFITMTPTIAGQIFQAIAVYDTTNFAIAETHRENMLASSDPDSYDFTTGWIPIYSEVAT